MGKRGHSVWRLLGYLALALTCTANHSARTLMILNSGSVNNFDTMWNTLSAINDPHGNKSLHDVYQLIEADSADFKAYIDPAWGDITELEIIGFNAIGDELCYVSFDVAGINVSHVDNWFKSFNILHTSMHNWDPKTTSTVVRDGNKELLILTNSTETWFSILHPSTTPGPDSRIVLAVNSSAALTVNSTVSDVVAEGCWANWELSLTLSFTDANSLTLQACLLSCTTPYVALQLGKNCFCGDFLTQHSPVEAMCTIACPGDGAYVCGGTNDGFYSVYSATYTSSELDTLSAQPESVPLISFSQGTSEYNYTINVTSELLSRGWMDGYIFIDGLSVSATNSTGHVMLFSFEYSYDMGLTFREYDNNGNHYFDTDGTPVNLHTLFVTSIRILYEWDVDQSTIHLYGPSASSYVSVPMIAVIAILDETPTTTDSANTTSIGPTTDPLTTTNSVDTTSIGQTTDPLTTTTVDTTSIGPTTDPLTTTTVDTTSIGPTTDPVTSAVTDTVTTTVSTNTTESITASPGTSTTNGPPQTTTSYLSSITSLYNVYPNMSVSINGTLYCPCNKTSNASSFQNLTSIYQDSNKTFEELLADLILDANTLSSNSRKYNSAKDMRASATTLGTLGLIVIVSSVSFIVYLDSATLVKEATKIKKTYKILKKRISKRSLKVESIDIQYKENVQSIQDMEALPDILN